MENLANSVPIQPAVYKGHIPPEHTLGVRNPSIFARRSAINALKALGKLPFDYDPGPLEVSKPKPVHKSKLRSFREYLHNKASSKVMPFCSDSSGLVNADSWDDLNHNPWARPQLWK